MTEEAKETPILTIHNQHPSEYPREPIRSDHGFVSYFEGTRGDQWLFVCDRETGNSYLTGGDAAWNVYPVNPFGDGPDPMHDLILDKAESMWLQACWEATRHLRPGAEVEVPGDVLTLSLAAEIWGQPLSTVRRHADEGKLKARKVGGVWLVTLGAMRQTYGERALISI